MELDEVRPAYVKDVFGDEDIEDHDFILVTQVSAPEFKEKKKRSELFDCIYCVDNPHRLRYLAPETLWRHCLENHGQLFPARSDELLKFREAYEEACRTQMPINRMEPVHVAYDYHNFNEYPYFSSCPEDPALYVSSQPLSGAPESNEPVSIVYDEDDGESDIDLEATSDGHRNYYGAAIDAASSLRKQLDTIDRYIHPYSKGHIINTWLGGPPWTPLGLSDDDSSSITTEDLSGPSGSYNPQSRPPVPISHQSAIEFLGNATQRFGESRFSNHQAVIGDNSASANNPSQSTFESTSSNPRLKHRADKGRDLAPLPPKRRRVPISITQSACLNCKRARAKCDGNTPCSRCSTGAETSPCVYEAHIKHSKGDLQKQICEIRAKYRLSKRIFKTLQLGENIPTVTRRSNGRHTGGYHLQHRGNPYASPLHMKQRENRRKVIRVRLKDKDHLACPDSGSENNIISKACALEHGFRIRSRKVKDLKRFEVGNGDIVWSIGRVFETVGLPGSPLWKKKRWFYVLENCPVPLVMGMQFLREAEILTKYRHLLENCPAEMSNISSLLWIGSPRNRLRCTIDGRQLVATADTGSDYNLMSLACAEREGFRIDRRTEARTHIVVGHGEVIETLGQVYVSNITLDWREPEAEPPERSPHTPTTGVPLEPDPRRSTYRPRGGDDYLYIAFHVIENLPCDIILGQKFLFDTDAFNKCPELLDIPTSKQNRQFEKHKLQFEFMILRSKILPHISFFKKPKLPIDLTEQHESNWHAERHRRSKNTEEIISLLPPDEQEAARKSERKKVREWNTAHARCKFCNTGSTT